MDNRKENLRKRRVPVFTIIGAGITELWYFTHLRDLFDYKMKIRPRFFGREDVKSIQKKIEQVLSGNGIAVCVFDADVTTWDEAEKKRFDAMIKKYANNKNVLVCESMPSIEYWFLLHFEDTHRYFGTSKAVIKELIRYIPNYDKTESFLSNPKWVAEMSSDDKMGVALKNASKKEGESFSNVDKIILMINK